MTQITKQIAIHRAVINEKSDYTQVALIEEGVVAEIDMEPADSAVMRVGDIYYSKVVRVIAALKVAFVEIGEKHCALLHFAQLPGEKISVGDWLLVQVTKLPRGDKGAVVTGYVQLIGVFIIYQAFGKGITIGKRITNEPERERLKQIVSTLVSADEGALLRTLAEGEQTEALQAEWQQLKAAWQSIMMQLPKIKKPQAVYREVSLACTYLRDHIKNVSNITVDDEHDYAQIKQFMQQWLLPWINVLQYKPGKNSLWFKYKIDALIQKLLTRNITLPSKGSVIIEFTEAMITVDVNSGQYVNASQNKDIAYQTNIEAARAIIDYIRLANLGGIIVMDFISMRDTTQQQAVMAVIKERLAHDTVHTNLFGFSPLGLVELSRQRIGNSWLENY